MKFMLEEIEVSWEWKSDPVSVQNDYWVLNSKLQNFIKLHHRTIDPKVSSCTLFLQFLDIA